MASGDRSGQGEWEAPIEQLSHHSEIFQYISLQNWSDDYRTFWDYLAIVGKPQRLFQVSLTSLIADS